eukprot:679466-Rhodomonas_salina.1
MSCRARDAARGVTCAAKSSAKRAHAWYERYGRGGLLRLISRRSDEGWGGSREREREEEEREAERSAAAALQVLSPLTFILILI